MVSKNLSGLPKSLIQQPFLRDVLTEDLVFYYEQHPERLSLSGSLKRIAYEHELQWGDQVLEQLLQQPALVLLWKSDHAKLDYGLLVLDSPGWAKTLALLLPWVGKDEAITQAGEVKLDGETQPVYAISAGPNTYYFLSKGDRLLVSNLSTVLLGGEKESRDHEQQRKQTLSKLLAQGAQAQGWLKEYQLPEQVAEHSLMLRSSYLSFGYGELFRGLPMLRFDFSAGHWSTHAWVNPASLQSDMMNSLPLLQAAPQGASLCAAAPMNWAQLLPALQAVSDNASQAQTLLQQLQAPALLCWYPHSRYYTPLLIVHSRSPLDGAYLGRLLHQAMPSRMGAEAWSEQRTSAGLTWQINIDSIYGPQGRAPGDSQFQVGAAQHQGWLLFSPDQRLVQQSLATVQKQYPALADHLPHGRVALYVSPKQLGPWLQNQVNASLPEESEPVFHAAVMAHLRPKLQHMAQHPNFMLAYPAQLPAEPSWVALEWQPTR